jgi:hypothetical protein
MGTEEVRPGSQIPARVHPDAEEILFVYEGRGRVRIGDQEVEIGNTPASIARRTSETSRKSRRLAARSRVVQ